MYPPHICTTAAFLFALLPQAWASFYDNPDVETPPKAGTPLDELKAKWDFEVRPEPINPTNPQRRLTP